MSEIPNPAETKERLLQTLQKYDFNRAIPGIRKGASNVYTGNALTSKDFSRDGANIDIAREVEDKLKTNNVVTLTGAYRMGTTSVGRYFVDLDKSERGYATFEMLSKGKYVDQFKKHYAQKDLFLDECPMNNEFFSTVGYLVGDSRRLVNRVHLQDLPVYMDKMKGMGINTPIVPIRPLSKDKMAEYVGKKLSLPKDDDLVGVISEISGGSLLVFSNILFDLAREPKLDVEAFEDAIGNVYNSIGHNLEGWDEQRKQVRVELAGLVPNPALEVFK